MLLDPIDLYVYAPDENKGFSSEAFYHQWILTRSALFVLVLVFMEDVGDHMSLEDLFPVAVGAVVAPPRAVLCVVAGHGDTDIALSSSRVTQ